jgi:hypothetical protein
VPFAPQLPFELGGPFVGEGAVASGFDGVFVEHETVGVVAAGSEG